MNRLEYQELLRLVRKLGDEVEKAPDDPEGRPTDGSGIGSIRDLYLPRVSKDFYYAPAVFRRLLGIG